MSDQKKSDTTPHDTATKPLVLASGSPRRRDLLTFLGARFTIHSAGIDETQHRGERVDAYATRLAFEKAHAIHAAHPDAFILGADTVVALDGNVLGKPADPDHARVTLALLSARTHTVTTGVALLHPLAHSAAPLASLDTSDPHYAHLAPAWDTLTVVTRVRMRNLTADEIERYITTGEPFDKAGGYGIQGAGGALIDTVEGSYLNVVGLPLAEVAALLTRHKLL